MAGRYRWLDDAWWRDWVFWIAVVVATANLVVGIADDARAAWWWLGWRWVYSFVVVVAVLGFGRVVVRSYREPEGGGA